MTLNLLARSQGPPSTSPTTSNATRDTPPQPQPRQHDFKLLERTLTMEESAISPATGRTISRHEASGLKSLTKEQHAKFWEEVTYWNRERFTEARWRQVRKRIRRAKQEHCMISLGHYPPPRPTYSFATPGGRHVPLYSSSSFTVPTGAHALRPAHLPRLETSSPTTPRPRWDVVSSGPATPLSATGGPIKNAFAEGGFWASLTSPKTPATAVPIPSTPLTAVPPEPWVPDTPSDPETKAVYEEVKHDVTKMALQLCASRYALRRSFNSDYDVIHPSMVRTKDTLLAAQVNLNASKLPLPLSAYIDACLPQKLDAYADEEAAGARQYSLRRREQLDDVDSWLQFNETTGELTTILEAQRDLLKMNKDRRKNRELAVGEIQMKLAWAVKVVDDSQYFADVAADGESDGSDEGYEYGNFLRTLGDGDASSLRSGSSTLDLSLTLTKNSSTTLSSGTDESIHLPHRSASSPIKSTHDAGFDNLPLRDRNFTLCNLSRGHSIHRRSNATATPTLSRRDQHGNLSINTSFGTPAVNSPSTMSLLERGTRHKGPSIEDLSGWAEELRKMERKRAEVSLGGGGGGHGHGSGEGGGGGVGGGRKQIRRFSTDGIEDDDEEDETVKTTETETKQKEDEEKTQKEDEEEKMERDGLMINGCVHPALRGGAHIAPASPGSEARTETTTRGGTRRGSRGSPSSWRCETSSLVEQNNRPCNIASVEHSIHSDTIEHNTSEDSTKPPDNSNSPNTDVYQPNNNNGEYSDADTYYEDDEDDTDTATTPTPSTMPIHTPTPLFPHPVRTSSSPTHAPIKMSGLLALRSSPTCPLPQALLTPVSSVSPPLAPRPENAVDKSEPASSSTPSTSPTPKPSLRLPPPRPPPILIPVVDGERKTRAYDRWGATSHERQLSRPVLPAPVPRSLPLLLRVAPHLPTIPLADIQTIQVAKRHGFQLQPQPQQTHPDLRAQQSHQDSDIHIHDPANHPAHHSAQHQRPPPPPPHTHPPPRPQTIPPPPPS